VVAAGAAGAVVAGVAQADSTKLAMNTILIRKVNLRVIIFSFESTYMVYLTRVKGSST